MAGSSSQIRAQAFSTLARDGQKIKDSDLIFTWKRNNATLLSASGRGKSSVQFAAPSFLGTDTITVTAETLDGTRKVEKSIRISSIDPITQLYERHPLFGTLFHLPIPDSINTFDSEKDFSAIPLFAAVSSPRSTDLRYEWKVQNQLLETDLEEPNNLKITTQNFSGPAAVELTITSTKDWTLGIRGLWSVVFGGSDSRNSGPMQNPFGTGQ